MRLDLPGSHSLWVEFCKYPFCRRAVKSMGLFSSFFSMGGVKLAADKMAAQINSARMSIGASNEFNEALVTPGALGIMYGFVFHVAQKARVKDEREVVRMFYQTCVRIFGPSQEELCVSITKEVIDF